MPHLLVVGPFQSAGRIIGWLKFQGLPLLSQLTRVSIRRADYWLVEGPLTPSVTTHDAVSIRRADYWLVEVYVPV